MTPTTEELAALCERLRRVAHPLDQAAADAIEALGGELAATRKGLYEERSYSADLYAQRNSARDERDSLRSENAALRTKLANHALHCPDNDPHNPDGIGT